METLNLLLQVRGAYFRLNYAWRVIRSGEIDFTHASILVAISETPNIRPSEVRKYFGYNHVYHAHLNELVTSGLVRRHKPGKTVTHLNLTKKGRKVAASFLREAETLGLMFWGDLPQSDLEAAGRVLSQLIERSA